MKHSQIAIALVRWYDKVASARDMPWRQTRDPYAIWLSEIMLQQTQVETVKPYFRRFLERFPTVSALAAAPLQDVLAAWAGLGYYRRAKHLHAAAQRVASHHGGTFPSTLEEIMALPGVGRYTAGAIASIVHNVPVPAVDGNVMRVLSRVAAYEKDVAVPRNQDFFWKAAEELHAGIERHGDLNQSIMELGATVCVPVNPRCGECPLRDLCRARAEGRQNELPVKGAKKASPVVRLTAMVILRESRKGEEVLLMQRPAGGIWEHMWEFPTLNAKTPGDREIDADAPATLLAGRVTHVLTHRRMEYRVMVCRVDAAKKIGLVKCGDAGATYEAMRWVKWPLVDAGLPMARVVEKIAAHAVQGMELKGNR